MFADRIICVVTLLLAAVYFYATAQIPSLEIGDPLGPKAFPRLLGVGLILSAVLLFIETVRGRKDEPARPALSREQRRHLWIIAAVVCWTALYFAVFEKLGYVIATTVYLLALTAYFNRGKWLANVLTSTLFCVGSYLLFSKALGVTLAPGVLPF
jgi:putative tricarboxylic transport membrane protein